MVHESQRRVLVRGLFWLVCVLPTAATVGWAYTRHSGVRRDHWQQELSATLGLRVTIDAVRNPRPGTLQFDRLRCYDAESDALVVDCRRVEIESLHGGWHVVCAQPEVFADVGERLFAAVERRLRRETPDADAPLEFSAAQLTWHVGNLTQTLLDFEAVAGPTESGRRLLVNFRMPGTEADQPASLQISRDAKKPASDTLIEFDTGRAAVPCGLSSSLVDLTATLGDQARFNGRLKLRHTAAGWEGVVAGDATEVELNRLVGARSPFQVWGVGEVRIHWAELLRGRVERIRGTLATGPGQMSAGLAIAGCEHLGLGGAEVQLPAGSEILFDALECDFALDSAGLVLKSCRADGHDALLWKGAAVYWRAPQVGPLPVANLLRALQPDRELLVPASPALAELMSKLPSAEAPAPEPMPAAAPGAIPAPKLRLRDPSANGKME